MANHRRTLAAAVATILASVSLFPIFIGTLWFWAGLGSVITVAAAGTVTRLRRLPVSACLAGNAAALFCYLNIAFANSRSLYHVLPTPASMRLLWDLAGQGFTEAATYAPPVPGLSGMVLLAAGGIGITALLTDLIAVRLGSASLAGLPLLLVFTEPFTLSVARGFADTTIAFIAGVIGYLALLSSESRDRIREWGRSDPSDPSDPSGRDTPDTRTLAAAGRRVGFASVLLALCMPLMIPGLHVTRLFGGQPGIGGNTSDGGSGGVGTVGFPNPNTQLSEELHTTTASTVLIYTTASQTPDYLQTYVLDRLTGNGWRLPRDPRPLARVSPRLPAPPGLTSRAWMSTVTTSVTIARGVSQDPLSALPVPYPATAVSAPGALRADPTTLMVFDPGTPLRGLRYSVTSLSASLPAHVLNGAPPPAADIAGPYLKVPASYNSLRRLAESVVRAARAVTPYQKAIALQNWLASGSFSYTLDAPTVLSASGLAKFLKVTKRGYCQQFSFAMAVLARLVDIPSRVAYGFTSGTPISDSQWQVTTHDAHAWPELYFQGYGWLRFEPTPSGPGGQGTATTPGYAQTPAGTAPATNPRTVPSTAPSTAIGTGSRSQAALRHQLRIQFGGGGAAGTAADSHPASPWEILGLTLAGLLMLTLAAPRCARLAIRRHRWNTARHRAGQSSRATVGSTARDATGDAAWANAAWLELRDDLADHGAGYLPSESPRALAARTGVSLALPDPALAALNRIALAEERARYSARPADGSGLRTDSVTVRRSIAAALPRRTRWRAQLLPVSVLGPALGMIISAADIFGRLNLGRFSRSRAQASMTRPRELGRPAA